MILTSAALEPVAIHSRAFVIVKWCSRIGAVITLAAGVAVLIGWTFHVAALKSIMPGFITMKANTALVFIGIAGALLCVRESAPSSRLYLAGRILALCTIALSAATLCEYLFDWDLGIDQLLFRDAAGAEIREFPGRMAPLTATNAILLCLAILSMKMRPSFFATYANWLAVPVYLIGMLALLGYAYDVTSLYKISVFNSMALHTAALFLLLGLCVFIADCSRGFMKIAVSDTAGGSVARRLLPTVPVIVVMVSYACHAGQRAGLYDGNFRRALMVASTIILLSYIVARITKTLFHTDVLRKQAEDEIVAMNAALEQRVLERTQELENTLAEVKQLSGLLPVCSYCRKVRDDKNYWDTVENYVSAHTDARFSHGICPTCMPRVRAEMGLKPRAPLSA